MKRQEELNEAWCKYRGKCSTEIMQALAFALRWCDEHPAWISVEDALPPKRQRVIAYNGVTNRIAWVLEDGSWIAETHQWKNQWKRNCFKTYPVTHWQHLPQPPSSSEIPNNHKKGGEQ